MVTPVNSTPPAAFSPDQLNDDKKFQSDVNSYNDAVDRLKQDLEDPEATPEQIKEDLKAVTAAKNVCEKDQPTSQADKGILNMIETLTNLLNGDVGGTPSRPDMLNYINSLERKYPTPPTPN